MEGWSSQVLQSFVDMKETKAATVLNKNRQLNTQLIAWCHLQISLRFHRSMDEN